MAIAAGILMMEADRDRTARRAVQHLGIAGARSRSTVLMAGAAESLKRAGPIRIVAGG